MSQIVTFLILLSQFSYGKSTFHACVPNTQFYKNDQLCRCDSLGRWSEADCRTVSRQQPCLPGQVVWQGCSQCICQENGKLLCSNARCSDDTPSVYSQRKHITDPILSSIGATCTPLRYYYVSCMLCQCPATGQTEDATCVVENDCAKTLESTELSLQQLNFTEKIICLPNIMYIFRCLHCLCSKIGHFVPEGCRNACVTNQNSLQRPKCVPKTYYKRNCNVCLCPDDGEQNEHFCTHRECDEETQPIALKTETNNCIPHTFTTSRCLYCDCRAGTVNENSCLQLNCIKKNDYNIVNDKCIPGEMVPICIECFCLKNGTTVDRYCSRSCSYQIKINILESALEDSSRNYNLIDREAIKKKTVSELCDPNTIYFENGRYCLCPENGNTNFKLCAAVTGEFGSENSAKVNTLMQDINQINIDFNIACKPSTFIEFDCNTCFCSKNGTIDPKWCTYDDCKAKRITQQSYKSSNKIDVKLSGSCIPGSISKENCNFCICPDNGFLKDRACTRNDCTGFVQMQSTDKFNCEPLAYYEVDCNICLCPRDGQKNVAKCTKNLCETNFLRSDYCAPGHLFSDDCKVCVCPPNGAKMDKVCTSNTCPATASAWKQIFKLSQRILTNQVIEESTRHLDLCFPGEEFVVGCKLCVCPDMGIRDYATCSEVLCNDDDLKNNRRAGKINTNNVEIIKNESTSEVAVVERRSEDCFIYNLSEHRPRERCTPGSMYVIKCQQCICPYLGNINMFCRPSPKDFYCEQAYPNFNYIPMGRRITGDNETLDTDTTSTGSPIPEKNNTITIKHIHTKYKCKVPGKISDDCFMCDCEPELVVIEEHCFKSNAQNCTEMEPSFLNKINYIVI